MDYKTEHYKIEDKSEIWKFYHKYKYLIGTRVAIEYIENNELNEYNAYSIYL